MGTPVSFGGFHIQACDNGRSHGFSFILTVTSTGTGLHRENVAAESISEGTDEIWICISRRSEIFDPSDLVSEQQQQDKIITGNKKRHQATLNDIIQSLSNCSVTDSLLGDKREGDNIKTV